MLQTLPETRERTQQELALQISLGSVFVVTKGYTSEEVGQTYARARELCLQLDDTAQLFPFWQASVCFMASEPSTGWPMSWRTNCLQLAQQTQDSAHLLTAHYALGQILLWLGEVSEAQQHLRKGIELYDAAQHHALAARYGEDPGVVCLAWEAYALFLLGYPDQALHRSREAIALAKDLAHPFSLVEALARLLTFGCIGAKRAVPRRRPRAPLL